MDHSSKLRTAKKIRIHEKYAYTVLGHTAEQGLITLELTKALFLDSNKAISEFETASPERKTDIIKNILWNCKVKDKKVLEYNYKSRYSTLANAPKNGDLTTMLTVFISLEPKNQ